MRKNWEGQGKFGNFLKVFTKWKVIKYENFRKSNAYFNFACSLSVAKTVFAGSASIVYFMLIYLLNIAFDISSL